MKRNKLTTITIILLILLITMVGFFGVYKIDKGAVNNEVKSYELSMNAEGKRQLALELDTETTTTIKDSQGNVIESATDEEISQNGYTKEEIPINKPEALTVENYNKVKEILGKRLTKLGAPDYFIRVDEETGKIVIDLPETENIDEITESLTTVGKLEIIDTQTKELLLDNSKIKTSEVYRNNTAEGTSIYFTIEFNEEGKSKLEEISKTYVKSSENTNTTTTETTQTEGETATTEENKTSEEKTVTMKLDDVEVLNSSFEDPVTNGIITLTVGKASTDTQTLSNNLEQARKMATILSNEPLPLTYKESGSNYIQEKDKDYIVEQTISIVTAVIVIAGIVFIIRYRLNGLLATTSNIGFTALLLLAIRYGNVVLSKEGLAALVMIIVLNTILMAKILSNLAKDEKTKIEAKTTINSTLKQFTLGIIPIFIIAVMFSFINWSSTSSFGMVMFWGLTLAELYNIGITKNLLKYKKM